MVRGLARRVRRSKRRRQGRSSKGIANRVRDKNEGRDREKDRRGGGRYSARVRKTRARETDGGERENTTSTVATRKFDFQIGVARTNGQRGRAGEQGGGANTRNPSKSRCVCQVGVRVSEEENVR